MKLAILRNSDVMKKTDYGFGLSDPKLYENNWFCFRTVLAVDLCYLKKIRDKDFRGGPPEFTVIISEKIFFNADI